MPKPRRLTTPGYGFEDVREPGAKLGWDEVERLLMEARTYWVASVRADGRPHVAPVWGVWLEESFVFETSDGSVKARNLLREPRCAVHIDHAEAGVIVEGQASRISDETLIRAFADAYVPKYDWDLEQYLSRPNSAVFRVVPRVAFSFREHLGQTATRWEF